MELTMTLSPGLVTAVMAHRTHGKKNFTYCYRFIIKDKTQE
jgi:hypothetical protein